MISRLLAVPAAMVFFAGAAVAADLPSKTAEPSYEAPPPIPVFSWTGVYAGIQAGYGFGRDNATLRAPGAGATAFGSTPNGIIGGGHIGANYALPAAIGNAKLIVGVEGDVDGADYQHSSGPFGGVFAGDTATTTSDIKGSARGRLGIGVNRVLFYATGGAAFASFATRYNATPGAAAFDSSSRTKTGYTVGGGVEYAFMNTVSVRAEYRYTDYGTFADTLGATGATVAHKETDNRIQAGVSYKFDSILPSPVTARY